MFSNLVPLVFSVQHCYCSESHLSPVTIVKQHAHALTPKSEIVNMCVLQMCGDCCSMISWLELEALWLCLYAFEVWQDRASGLNQTRVSEDIHYVVQEVGLQKQGLHTSNNQWSVKLEFIPMTFMYLKHIFIISSCHLLQFRQVGSYSSNNISSEGRDFLKPVRRWMIRVYPTQILHTVYPVHAWVMDLDSPRYAIDAFQTPSSTSCKRSTTTMSNMLKPKLPRHSENTFWLIDISMDITLKWKPRCYTKVGTRESSRDNCSTATPLTVLFFLYIRSCAALTRLHCLMSSICDKVLLCVISLDLPMLFTWSNRIRHQGHGQRPRFRILTMRILQKMKFTWNTHRWQIWTYFSR